FTSLSADQIDHAMSGCPSRQQVLILDCCYSGAFPVGHIAKAGTEVYALERFQGRGRTVLTASDATQYSFEGNQLRGEAAQSVFTRYLVAGLRDGSADLDGDGDIALDELYSYDYDRVIEEMPQQRPKKQDNVEGRTIIARNINWSLPTYLRNALNSPIATDRLGALDGLNHLYRIGNDTVRARVRDEIQRLTDDDSKMVSTAAAERLRSILHQPPAQPTQQVYDVSKPEIEKAPKPPAPQATETPAQQAGFSVPIAVPVAAPDPVAPTTQPPIQPAIELQPPRRRFGSGVITRLTASIGLALGWPWRFLRKLWSGGGTPDTSQLPGPLAGFGARMRSFLIDAVVPCILCSAAVIPPAVILGNSSAVYKHDSVVTLLILIIVAASVGLVAFAVWNSGYRQGTTGQSICRRVTKTKLVKIQTGKPIGFGMALRRLTLLVMMVIPYAIPAVISYLRSLRDPKRQTGTDKIFKAVVVSIDDAAIRPIGPVSR
ncbi:MAG: RDD family protein, partial [Pseudonocardiaceae bacterium]